MGGVDTRRHLMVLVGWEIGLATIEAARKHFDCSKPRGTICAIVARDLCTRGAHNITASECATSKPVCEHGRWDAAEELPTEPGVENACRLG